MNKSIDKEDKKMPLGQCRQTWFHWFEYFVLGRRADPFREGDDITEESDSQGVCRTPWKMPVYGFFK